MKLGSAYLATRQIEVNECCKFNAMLKLAGFVNDAINIGEKFKDKVLTLNVKTSNNHILDEFLELLSVLSLKLPEIHHQAIKFHLSTVQAGLEIHNGLFFEEQMMVLARNLRDMRTHDYDNLIVWRKPHIIRQFEK